MWTSEADIHADHDMTDPTRPPSIELELLLRYLAGDLTPDERRAVDERLATDREHRVALDALAHAFPDAAGRSGPWSSDPLWRRLEAELVERPRVASHPRPVTRLHVVHARREAPRWWLRAAAVLAIAVSGALLWQPLSGVVSRYRTPPAREWATGKGERATFRLADGTRVTLAADSKLRYAAPFDASARDVYLEGEGYFEVVHDSARPFTVHAGSAVARDIGTAFVVRAYAGDTAVQVVVAEGEVALSAKGAEGGGAGDQSGRASGTRLTRGQLGQLKKGERVVSVESVDVGAYLGWTEGRLVFDETPLPEVARQLGRWYGAEVRLADSALASRRLTASLKDKSLAEVLELMAQSLDVRYERQGAAVVLYPRETAR